MMLNWIRRDYVMEEIRCIKRLKDSSLEFRVRFFGVIHLPPNCFPKLIAASEIDRRSGRSMKRKNDGEIEMSWYQF